jgi:hypothetical protein
MPELLFLHTLDEWVSAQPDNMPDLPAVPPFVWVRLPCGHYPPRCTLGRESARDGLRLTCVACGDALVVAVSMSSENPEPCAHVPQRVVLYSEGRLAVYYAECARALSVWDVAPYRPL